MQGMTAKGKGEAGGEAPGEAKLAGKRAEELDTARLVTRFQAGDREAFADLYLRYYDRVHAYLKIVFDDPHEAEDGAQQVFVNVLESLHRYERRDKPFAAWLFTVVRNYAITQVRKLSRIEPEDPFELNRLREKESAEEAELRALEWMSDSDMLAFIERLPLPQRQVTLLRYMLGLTNAEIAKVLKLTPNHVRVLQYRARGFLKERLVNLDHSAEGQERAKMKRWGGQATVLRSRRYVLFL